MKQTPEDAPKVDATVSARIAKAKHETLKEMSAAIARANGGYGPTVSQLVAEAIDEYLSKRAKPKRKK